MHQYLNFINGEFVATGKTFENHAPVDNRVLGLVHEAGEREVDAAVGAARAALKGDWGRMSVVKRVELLYAVADEINRRFDDFLQAEVADTGKPLSLASHIDIPRGAANFKVFADIVKNVPTESFEMATPDGGTALSYALRSPLGVVAVVCPWNLPLLLMTWKVGPALACGNTVVVKPSEETPATATLLGEVMNAVGVPKGVYNVVHGFGPGSAGEFLTRHPASTASPSPARPAPARPSWPPPPRACARSASSWAARTPASCSPMPTSTRRWPASPAAPSRTAARSAWAPSASMCSAPSSTASCRP
jgi:aminomuconate-semialdehyde/2-hydroxymuconate-6-semialdehyde dehydrogenase